MLLMENYEKYKKVLALMFQNRLHVLLKLLDKLEKGEKCMSFKEFDM